MNTTFLGIALAATLGVSSAAGQEMESKYALWRHSAQAGNVTVVYWDNSRYFSSTVERMGLSGIEVFEASVQSDPEFHFHAPLRLKWAIFSGFELLKVGRSIRSSPDDLIPQAVMAELGLASTSGKVKKLCLTRWGSAADLLSLYLSSGDLQDAKDYLREIVSSSNRLIGKNSALYYPTFSRLMESPLTSMEIERIRIADVADEPTDFLVLFALWTKDQALLAKTVKERGTESRIFDALADEVFRCLARDHSQLALEFLEKHGYWRGKDTSLGHSTWTGDKEEDA